MKLAAPRPYGQTRAEPETAGSGSRRLRCGEMRCVNGQRCHSSFGSSYCTYSPVAYTNFQLPTSDQGISSVTVFTTPKMGDIPTETCASDPTSTHVMAYGCGLTRVLTYEGSEKDSLINCENDENATFCKSNGVVNIVSSICPAGNLKFILRVRC